VFLLPGSRCYFEKRASKENLFENTVTCFSDEDARLDW
jgi:hypothetical protein